MATAADLDRDTNYRVPHGFFTSESKHARPVDKRFHCATL